MYKRVPLVITPIRITRMTNRTQTRTRRFINRLIRSLNNSSKLRSSYNGRLLVGHNINIFVKCVRCLHLRLVNKNHLSRRALLLNRTKRMRRKAAVRRTTQYSNRDLLHNTLQRNTISRSTVTINNGQHNVSRHVIRVTSFMLNVQICIREAMLQGVNIFRHNTNKFITNGHIRRRVANKTILRLISGLSTFTSRLQQKIRRTSRRGLTLSNRINGALQYFKQGANRRHKDFKDTAIVTNAIGRKVLVRRRPLLARYVSRHNIRNRTANRSGNNQRTVVHSHSTRQMRRCQRHITLPHNRTSRRQRLHRTKGPTLNNLIVRCTPSVTFNNLGRAHIARRQVRPSVTKDRRLNSTKKVNVNRLRLHNRLVRVLRQQ